jgi:hypothetical protein
VNFGRRQIAPLPTQNAGYLLPWPGGIFAAHPRLICERLAESFSI